MKRNWFSNFVPYNVSLLEDGIEYRTPEHYYQAHKSLIYRERQHTAQLESPGAAKRIGKDLTLRHDWNYMKVIVMTRAILWRLETDIKWTEQLMAHKPSERIVETNTWHDNFWGDCICSKPECKIPGKNMLGSILQSLRDNILQSLRN